MKIEIAGQNAFIVYFGDQASATVSAQIQAAVNNINDSMADCLVDMVPSYASLLVIFDLDRSEPFAVRRMLRAALTDLDAVDASAGGHRSIASTQSVLRPVSLTSGKSMSVSPRRAWRHPDKRFRAVRSQLPIARRRFTRRFRPVAGI